MECSGLIAPLNTLSLVTDHWLSSTWTVTKYAFECSRVISPGTALMFVVLTLFLCPRCVGQACCKVAEVSIHPSCCRRNQENSSFLVVLDCDPRPRFYMASFLVFDCLYEGFETLSAHFMVRFSVGSAGHRRHKIRDM